MSVPDRTEVTWQVVLKQFATALSVAAGVLSVAGFLAVRSAVNALGLPGYVSISLDAYLQNGGRFVFAFLAHLLLIGIVLYALVVLWRLARRARPDGGELSPRTLSFGLVVVSLACLALELLLLDAPRLFGPEPVTAAASSADVNLVKLLLIETLTVVSVVVLFQLAHAAVAEPAARKVDRAGLALLSLMVGVQVMLVPVCFGKVSIAPNTFARVSIELDGDARIDGALVYRDETDYYLWSPDALVQVTRDRVLSIRFGLYEDVQTMREP